MSRGLRGGSVPQITNKPITDFPARVVVSSIPPPHLEDAPGLEIGLVFIAGNQHLTPLHSN
jgi:hypothetical protein